MKSAKDAIIPYPMTSTWVEFFARWNKPIVDQLDHRFCQADRQDAVMHAFTKLMDRTESYYGSCVPETEGAWRGKLVWQAKSYLSHLAAARNTRETYHRKAVDDGFHSMSVPDGILRLDRDIRSQALYRTLFELSAEARMKPKHVEAYVRRYLDGESSSEVARSCGITENHLYQIRLRIEKMLESHGKDRFRSIQRRLFLEAA